MKKVVLVIALLSAVAGITFWLWPTSENPKPALHSWIKNTGKIIKSIGHQILPPVDKSNLPESSLPGQEPAVNAISSPKSVNWHYTPEHDAPLQTFDSEKQMLPDMFSKKVPVPTTSLNGKVHLDEGDNFEGAEVGLEIPTKL